MCLGQFYYQTHFLIGKNTRNRMDNAGMHAGMPSNWKDSTKIALYKGKGDALDCT